ncbi:CD2 antigen cytoplasmic tail-binding protein 2 homolog [Diorhabda carinulata]|uniref:CD2 antigen cytoplasmic tail-binding protein 2 homolog n=1 Tax=Diorhabda sublineata TaxID=1163346 RepID=UPI0024E103ED|nr:CD2 antigen cytoplasmic tail-binding protein 2 homolog [Diorhabda sublineata]XP_057658874.1 CD2 antigen cytoplasmic tail-binding protein 2 homolog [Diorhabda carinulata]
MAKRNYDNAFMETKIKANDTGRQTNKKHTLDSDEEDDEIDEDNVLQADDIEGEEEGIARLDGEQKLTAFNMNEEMEEGHFDRDGHFIWNNEKEIRDSWLDNIDWEKIKANAGSDKKYNLYEKGLGSESDTESEDDQFDEIKAYKKMLKYMKPKETVNKSLKRLGGADMKLSSVERLKRKKAGTLIDSKDVTDLTEIANEILTKQGNMDVYQETYEQIHSKIARSEKKPTKEPELDMYADDFDEKEKAKIEEETTSSKSNELTWEFKWKIEDEETHGPFTTSQMVKWNQENYFKSGVMVRKCGENTNFYSLERIDFELYE